MPKPARSTVTLLFSDVEGSTRLIQALAAHRWSARETPMPS